MIPLVTTVFLASVAGGLHCVGMCGAFLGIAVSTQGEPEVSKARLHAAYHVGRLVSYSTLGVIGGAIGGSVDVAGKLSGIERPAAIMAGGLLLLFGLKALLGAIGVNIGHAKAPQFLIRLSSAGHRAVFSLPPLSRAAAVGLLTTLLPCAWLWAFVFVAAGTADPLLGLASMGAFWLGTLPLLGAFGLGLDSLLRRAGRAVPVLTSLALIAVGAWTMTRRLTVPLDLASLSHDAGIVNTNGGQTPMPRVSDMPCCEK